MIRKQHLLLICLVIASLSLIGNGAYIKVKAKVADWMIANTWEARQLNPRLAVSQYVMQDASGESLAFGPGAVIPMTRNHYHFIAGHRDTHFDYLDQIAIGDTIEIESYDGHQQQYLITETNIVDVRQGAFYVDEFHAGLSLMTCWPMDSIVPGGPLRYVVSGEKIS